VSPPDLSYESTSASGSVTTPISLKYQAGDMVYLYAPSINDSGNWFLWWEGCDNTPPVFTPDMVDYSCSVFMGYDRTVTAVYAPPVTVTVTASQPDVTIVVDWNYGLPVPQTFTWASGSVHYIEAMSPQLSYTDGLNYFFTSWSDGGGQGHMITPSSTETLTASFAATLLPARVNGYYYETIFDACVYSYGATVETQTTTFVGDLILSYGYDFTLNGGYDSTYSPHPAGMTTLQGKLIVEKGSLIVNRLTVR
jgi:hypothetical protein